MKTVFVRHTSVGVAKGICYGRTDVPLSSTFPEEAASVASRLAGRRFDHVFSSPLSRCVRLAEACGYPDPRLDARLLEMDFGEWEMKRFDEISDPRLQLWYSDFINVAPTGGESSAAQRKRLEQFLETLRGECGADDTVGVFTHGGILIHASVVLGGLTYEEAFSRLPGYGSIAEYEL